MQQVGATSIAIARTEDEAVSAAHKQVPDIILADVNLQAGTGPKAVETIRSAYGNIPVIFITATPDACLSCELPNIVLEKPVDVERMIGHFKRLAFNLIASRHESG